MFNDQWCECPPGEKCISKTLDDGTTCPAYSPSKHKCYCNEYTCVPLIYIATTLT